MDTSTGAAVVLHLDQFEVPEVLAGVRGILDLALERCAPGSAAALEICAAWEGLDAASATPLIVPTLPPGLGSLRGLHVDFRATGGYVLLPPSFGQTKA